MRNSVANGFIEITKEHEGIVPWPYLDRLGLVTTAIGNLIEDRATGKPTENYFEQPWRDASGNLASRAELQEAWDLVKSRQDLAHLGGGNQAFANLTSVRLGPPGVGVNEITPEILSFVQSVLLNFESIVKQGVPNFEALAADAQLALLEHAWAVGPNMSGWPHLCSALAKNPPDYQTAQIEDHQVGVTAIRDQMTRDLWQNAIDGQFSGADPDILYYPGTVNSPATHSGSLSAASVRAGPNLAMSRKAKFGLGLSFLIGGGAIAYNYSPPFSKWIDGTLAAPVMRTARKAFR